MNYGKLNRSCRKDKVSSFYTGLFLIGLFFVSCLAVGQSQADDGKVWLDAKYHPTRIDVKAPSFAPIIEEFGGAIANISIEGKEKVSNQIQIPGFGGQDDLPFDLFGGPTPKERRFTSLGSGFVIHPDGYLVTNYHVVEKATKIIVTFKDEKQRYTAKLVGKDKKSDIALLKIEGQKNMPSVVLGDSDAVKPGDWAIAVGNPFGLGHTATLGIVSAKGRHVPGGAPYDGFIQTDTAINHGNSGGPLLNSKGEVIGVNSAIFSPGRTMGGGGFNIGIGFSIPINMVKDIITQLHASGKVTRGWLGVLIQQVTPEIAQSLQLKEASGALVADVMKVSPAEKAGIQRGDIIVEYDGRVVRENEDLPQMVASTPIGKVVDVVVLRKNKPKTISVTIEQLADDSLQDEEADKEEAGEEKLGLSLQEITPDIARSLGLDLNTKGLVVVRVAVDGVAALSGLRPKDVIIEIDSHPVATIAEFRDATKSLSPEKPVLVLLRRGTNTIFLTLKMEE